MLMLRDVLLLLVLLFPHLIDVRCDCAFYIIGVPMVMSVCKISHFLFIACSLFNLYTVGIKEQNRIEINYLYYTNRECRMMVKFANSPEEGGTITHISSPSS